MTIDFDKHRPIVEFATRAVKQWAETLWHEEPFESIEVTCEMLDESKRFDMTIDAEASVHLDIDVGRTWTRVQLAELKAQAEIKEARSIEDLIAASSGAPRDPLPSRARLRRLAKLESELDELGDIGAPDVAEDPTKGFERLEPDQRDEDDGVRIPIGKAPDLTNPLIRAKVEELIALIGQTKHEPITFVLEGPGIAELKVACAAVTARSARNPDVSRLLRAAMKVLGQA